MLAKLLAGCGLALAAIVDLPRAAAIGNLIAGGSWEIELSHLGEGALYELFGMLGALALGLLLMHSALAIVTYFVLPTVVGIVVEVVPGLDDPAKWFEPDAVDDAARRGHDPRRWTGPTSPSPRRSGSASRSCSASCGSPATSSSEPRRAGRLGEPGGGAPEAHRELPAAEAPGRRGARRDPRGGARLVPAPEHGDRATRSPSTS